MALIDVDSWLTEFESCSRLNHTLLSQLNQRSNKQHLSAEYVRLSASIQVGIKQLDRELQQLKLKLNEASQENRITFEEAERRQRQLDGLNSQRQILQTKYTQTTRDDRSELLATSGGSNWPATTRSERDTGEDSGDAAPIIDTTDVQRLKQHQIDILEEQNRGLESLSQTISRQRAIATQLGTEVENQNDILDNLANTMERVESGVSRETTNISLVNRRDSTWGYWMIIIILMVAIVIVALI